MTEGLQYHLENKLPITENIFRAGSSKYFELFHEVRTLYNEGKIELTNEEDKYFIGETLVGEVGMYKGKEVYLDFPMPTRETLDEMLQEAKYRGRKVKLNKPKRGGPKKFYVYTKNKKGNVVKVNFGAKSGGGKLAVKLKDPKARKAFADRHNCEDKNDKTKPGYWSCRLPRYAKALGLTQVSARFW